MLNLELFVMCGEERQNASDEIQIMLFLHQIHQL